MFPTPRVSISSNVPQAQPNMKGELPNSTLFTHSIVEIKNTTEPAFNIKPETPVSGSLMQRRQRRELTLEIPNAPKVMIEQAPLDFEKLKVSSDKLSDDYISVVSSRYPSVETAVKTQISIKDETTGEPIPLPANYLQVADKNIAIRTQYPKNETSFIEQHLKMLMTEKTSVLVVIASQNDIDGESLRKDTEMHLPPYYDRDAKYGSVEVKSEANGTEKYASQIGAKRYQLTLTKDGQKVELPVIHVTDWGDRRTIPVEALRALAVDINQYVKGEGDLPVIHCMSGSGRAGTVVAAMQLVQPDNQYSTHEVIKSLRETGTPHMVQTKEQYQTLTELGTKMV
nr:hypothetical protein [Providencia stuartii]ELR5083698.1 hypothetical protein [Providencia stuartii]